MENFLLNAVPLMILYSDHKGEILSQTERVDGHYRRFIILEEFKQRLIQIGFKIIEKIESNGLAKFGKERIQ